MLTFLRRGIQIRSIAALAVLLVLMARGFYPTPAGAQSARTGYEQDIERVFSSHEDVRLDPAAVAQRVRNSGHLSLQTSAHSFEIELVPNDLRAPNYRAEETGDGGVVRTLPRGPVNTYKGQVVGQPDTGARFTIDDGKIEGMILTAQDSYFIESARKYSPSAETTDFLLYKASDVRPEFSRTCGTLDEEIRAEAKQLEKSSATSSSLTPNAFSPFKVAEIATESDGEYTTALGGSAAANSDILSIMNQVQAIYQRDIGLTFSVVFQHTWTNANTDPYVTSGNPVTMLNEFTDYWNANFTGTARDLTHLWTGRSLGGPAGVAWQGVVCRAGAPAYGLSDLETIAPFRVGIPAHEIGHNFNASHCDGQAGCDNTIMVAIQNQSNTLTFCPFSINEITTYINGNSSCLSNAAGNPIDQPDFFVRQHYSDFLNRQPDQSGLDFWIGNFTPCGTDPQCIEVRRINVSAAFFLSIEFQQTGFLVERIYKTAYADATGTSTLNGPHTLPVPILRFSEFLTDTATIGQNVIVGQTGWEQQLETNKQNFTAAFVARPRFTSAYPQGMLPATFVDTLNRNAGSPLSAAELATLIAEHTAGTKNRAQVLRQIAEHPNLAGSNGTEFKRAFVLMQFFGYLRRNPNDPPDTDYTGYDFWLTKLNQFGNYQNAEMVKAFLRSDEYRHRFGP